MRTAAAIHVEDLRVQHDRLFGYIALLRNGSPASTVRVVLEDFATYFQIHASDEEQFMEAHAYPYLKEHRREHECLLAAIRALQTTEDMQVTGAIARRLDELLESHIRKVDGGYVAYFRRKGVLAPCSTSGSYEI